MKVRLEMVTVCVALLATLPAWGASTVIEDEDRGWYDSRGATELPNTNYLAGECTSEGCGFAFAEYRNFFIFDLSAVAGTIASATLLLWLPEDGFVSPTGTETFELFHVATSADVLGQEWGVEIFDDLGSGTSYGAYVAMEADERTLLEIRLNEAAMSELNSVPGLFAIGGAVTSLDPETNDELLFGHSGYTHARLVLETVPLPGAAWLLASAVLLLSRRRRSKEVEGMRGDHRSGYRGRRHPLGLSGVMQIRANLPRPRPTLPALRLRPPAPAVPLRTGCGSG